jgi:hypothetical protein
MESLVDDVTIRSTLSRMSELYRHRLVLVRPDQHVAWRGDAEPADPISLVDLVRGAAHPTVAKAQEPLDRKQR